MSIEPIGIGFGTAGLGSTVFDSVTLALEAGFRKFDTAEEHDYWYDQASVGRALSHFFLPELTTKKIDLNLELKLIEISLLISK